MSDEISMVFFVTMSIKTADSMQPQIHSPMHIDMLLQFI